MQSWQGIKADYRSPRPYILYALFLIVAAVLLTRYPVVTSLGWLGVYLGIFATIEAGCFVYAWLRAPRRS